MKRLGGRSGGEAENIEREIEEQLWESIIHSSHNVTIVHVICAKVKYLYPTMRPRLPYTYQGITSISPWAR